jgi:hypothetical protein
VRISKRRIAKIRARFDGKFLGLRQTDGSVKYINRDRLDEALADATNGRDTPATRALLCAESATDGSHIHQLLQGLRRPAYVSQQPIVKVIQ